MEPGEDEELSAGSDRAPLSRRTKSVLGVVAALAVLVAAVVVLTATRDDDRRPDAAPTRSTRPASAPAPALSVPVTVTSPPEPPCLDIGGSRLNCVSSGDLPASFLRSVRAALPGATVRTASTVVGRSGAVYSRQVAVHDRLGRTLRVDVGPPTGRRSLITVPSSADPRLITLDLDARRRHITLTVDTPSGRTPPPVPALRRLAEDPSLVAT